MNMEHRRIAPLEVPTEPDRGERISCTASTPIKGGRADVCWFVESGCVDLFALTLDEDGREGARHPLFRVEAGGMIVGLEAPDQAITLLLVGSRHCELREMPFLDALWRPEAHSAAKDWAHRLASLAQDGTENAPEAQAISAALEDIEGDNPAAGLRDMAAPVTACLARKIATRDATAMARISQRAALELSTESAAVARASGILTDRADIAAPGTTTDAANPLAYAFGIVAREVGAENLVLDAPSIRGKADARLRSLAHLNKLRTRKVLLRDDWYDHDNGPLIAFRGEDRAPVALVRDKSGRYCLTDGEGTTPERVTAQNATALSGDAITIYRTVPAARVGLRDLMRLSARTIRREAILIFFMGLCASLLAMATPLVTGYLVSEVIPRAEVGRLVEASIALVVMAFGAAAFRLVQGVNVLRMESRIDHILQSALFERLLMLPTKFFGHFAVGDLADRCLSLMKIRTILSGNTLQALLLGIFSLTSFALLFFINWRLAIVATLFVIVITALVGTLTLFQRRAQAAIIRNQGTLDGLTVQMVSAVGKLRIAVAERRAFSRWLMKLVDQKQRERQVQRWANWTETVSAMIPVLASAAIFVAASLILQDMADQAALEALVGADPDDPGAEPNVLSTSDFLSFNAAFGQFLAGFLGIALALSGLVEIGPLLDRVRPILETAPDHVSGHADPGVLSGEIETRNLTFRYTPTGPAIIDRLDLTIEAGEYVAIIGSSGSGKSTLIRLLIGFETPEDGDVLFDDKPISDLDLGALRSQIGVVLQNGRINPGSIGGNITGSTGASVEDAWAAAKLAGLHKDIKAMPMGMHTVMVDGAQTLSVGQRQRVLLARALVQKPRILILDEATSALDNRTQAIVVENLQNLRATRIVIAHRLSTIMDADRIIVMDKGRVAQSGSYQELMDTPGLFRDLATRQLA